MSKKFRWIYIGQVLSIILFIASIIIFSSIEKNIDANIVTESVVITDVQYYPYGDEFSTYYTTIAKFISNGKEFSVELSGKDLSVGDTINVYKYSDNYYIGTPSITIHSHPYIFVLLILGLFGTFFFFPIQFYFAKKDMKKQTNND